MMLKNKQKSARNDFLQYGAFLVFSIPVFLMFLFMRTVLLIGRIKLHFTEPKEGRLSLYHGGKMFEMQQLPTEERIDFAKHRSSTYIQEMTFGCLWEFSKFAGNKQRVPLIRDDVIQSIITHSVFSHGLVRVENDPDIIWNLPFDLQGYKIFEGFYWDISQIRIHKNCGISILDRCGGVHTPKSPTWNLAKAHAQAQLTFFAPGLAHNHVHFVFPTIMACFVRKVLPQTSLLRQLLEPHTRFTQYINYQALNVCQSSCNSGCFFDRWFRPWLSFPISNDDFLNGIKENCEKFYYDNFTLTQDLQEDLPYHKYLKEYYSVIEKFVAKLEPLLKEDFEKLSSSVEEFLPTIKQRTTREVVTTLIWNCGVVHFCDHQSFLKYFADEYGCMSIRIPLVSTKTEKQINGYQKHFENHDHSSYFEAEDIYRTRCFLRTFVKFNPCSLDLTLPNTRYKFTNQAAVSVGEEFQANLEQLDQKLYDDNLNIIPLPEIIGTVCF